MAQAIDHPQGQCNAHAGDIAYPGARYAALLFYECRFVLKLHEMRPELILHSLAFGQLPCCGHLFLLLEISIECFCGFSIACAAVAAFFGAMARCDPCFPLLAERG